MAKNVTPRNRPPAPSKRGRTPVPTPQDGALGAGGTSALVVILTHLFPNFPTAVLVAVAPFLSVGLSFLLAAIGQWYRDREAANDIEEYVREIKELINGGTLPEETTAQLQVQLNEILVLKVEERRRRIMTRHVEVISTLSTTSSDV